MSVWVIGSALEREFLTCVNFIGLIISLCLYVLRWLSNKYTYSNLSLSQERVLTWKEPWEDKTAEKIQSTRSC